MSVEEAASPPHYQAMVERRVVIMSERDNAALFAAAERAERTSNDAIGMIARQAERIQALERRIAALETPPPSRPYEDAAEPPV